MPSPLGHVTIGLATHSVLHRNESILAEWKTLIFAVFLANLPDIDVIVGLVIHGNGNVFHRGPTHSLLFALLISLVASNVWRRWSVVPRVSFLWCFLLVLSHILGDAVFTSTPVSLLWPLEVNWSAGYSGWTDVVRSVYWGAFRDVAIIFGFGLLLVINRLFRYRVMPYLAQKPIGTEPMVTSKRK